MPKHQRIGSINNYGERRARTGAPGMNYGFQQVMDHRTGCKLGVFPQQCKRFTDLFLSDSSYTPWLAIVSEDQSYSSFLTYARGFLAVFFRKFPVLTLWFLRHCAQYNLLFITFAICKNLLLALPVATSMGSERN